MNTSPYRLEGHIFWRTNMQLSVTRERERFSLPIHVHDFIEINYVAEGKGHHYIGDERLSVEQKDLFVIPVGTQHVYRPVSQEPKDELIVYNCLIGPDMLTRLQRAYPLPEDMDTLLTAEGQPYRRLTDTGGEVRRIMEGLHMEYMMRQPGYESFMCAHLTQLLLTLYRLYQQEGAASGAYSEIGIIFDYIHAHYAQPLVLKELAALIPISVSHLQRLFKTATGQSFTEFIQNLRIEKSCDLLLQTSLSIGDISGRVGYRDIKFFHALFKKKTGMSPNRYRKRAQSAALGLSFDYNSPT
ncbi:helix-turn-helix domain-containing protein [Paenibacillus mendelii]|uniref:Helix-turn-helix domain-containing protein n=1 Tax=Paenibacillus mendelii TaxID=206163 RepID=A0ABV6JAF0_9BACL|nr:helix-turn-helix domain-containing protein [Paenibacillus mendelii]MCQ6562117.1 helix-turn-helix domain-containing protein [Paenibacillus mendelii]